MERYFVDFKGVSLKRAEALMRVVHAAITSCPPPVPGSSATDGPVSVAPAGSFLLRAAVHQAPASCDGMSSFSASADVVVTLPSSFCSVDDVQEGSYLLKRREFLEHLRAHLESILVADCSSGDAAGELVVPSAVDEADRVALRGSRVAIATEAFHHSTLKSCITVTLAAEGAPTGPSSAVACEAGQRGIRTVRVHVRPSAVTANVASKKAVAKHPLYSHLVMEDYLMIEALEKLHNTFSSCPTAFRAAIILRAWAAHTGLSGFRGGLTGFVLSAMVLRLLEEGIVAPSMTDDNIVRAAWVQLSRGAFSTSAETNLPLAGHHINALFRTTPRFMNEHVRAAAEAAIRFASPLDLFSRAPFVAPSLRGDLSLRITRLPTVSVPALDGVMKSRLEREPLQAAEAALEALITRGLAGRVDRVHCVMSATGSTAVVSLRVAKESDARSRLIRGPSIEDEAAVAEFNEFWGADGVSTRQFPDGGINRCVLFERPDIAPTVFAPLGDVVTDIVARIATRHVAPDAAVVVVLDDTRQLLLERTGSAWTDVQLNGEAALRAAAKQVTASVLGLGPSALPCKVSSFDIISAAARSTDVFGVRPHISLTLSSAPLPPLTSAAASIDPVHCVLTIDDKHKIPDALDAIAKMKGALCAQLCKALQRDYVSFCTSSSVDVIAAGFLFRIYIAHYREVSLLNALQRAPEAELLERKLFWSTRHAALMRSLADGHAAFGITVRLAKRWVGAMLMSDFIAPEAVELLVAYVFLSGEQNGGAPAMAGAGFLRFLQLLHSFDWANETLAFPFVDAAEMASGSRPEHASMWIAAPYAPDQSPFTKLTPRPLVMERLVRLATSSFAVLLRALTAAAEDDIHLLGTDVAAASPYTAACAGCFRPSHAEFDVVLQLCPELMLHPQRAVTAPADRVAALSIRRMWHLDELRDNERQRYVHQLAELDPAGQCVRTVRAHTRDSSMVFFDALGPVDVGITLLASRPSEKQLRDVLRTLHRVLPGAFSNLPAMLTAAEANEAKVANGSGAGGGDGKRSREKRTTPLRKRDGHAGAGSGAGAGAGGERRRERKEEQLPSEALRRPRNTPKRPSSATPCPKSKRGEGRQAAPTAELAAAAVPPATRHSEGRRNRSVIKSTGGAKQGKAPKRTNTVKSH